jgi:DNA (cytosine-5)-methyltransferase 1
MHKPTVVSFFSGAGGMDIGFSMAGFKTLACFEFDENCCATLRKNMSGAKVYQADVSQLTAEEVLKLVGLKKGQVDVVIGGPPCQSFSLAGNRKGMFDKRGKLVGHFIDLVKGIAPKTFVMENVKGMLSWSDGKAVRYVEEAFEEPIKVNGKTASYVVARRCLNAADFGVPQFRERLIFLGTRVDSKAIEFPSPTHFCPEKNPLLLPHYVGAGEVLRRLPQPEQPSELALRIAGTITKRNKKLGYE